MLKGSTVKEVNVCFVDKGIHSSSLINVQPEENCRIDELLCCSDVEVLVCKAIQEMFKCWEPKKIGVDWPRQSQFQKNFQRVKRWNWKIGVDRSRQSKKKGPLQRQVSLKISSQLVTLGSPKGFALWWPDLDKRCSSCYTLRGCVFADVQSREELKMLLQAKRQPS